MPEYCYTCESCGWDIERFFKMGHARKSVKCRECGEMASRNFAAEHGQMHIADYGPNGKTWYDIATHPEDVASEREVFKQAGIKAEIKADGGIVTHSDKERQKVLKLIGL